MHKHHSLVIYDGNMLLMAKPSSGISCEVQRILDDYECWFGIEQTFGSTHDCFSTKYLALLLSLSALPVSVGWCDPKISEKNQSMKSLDSFICWLILLHSGRRLFSSCLSDASSEIPCCHGTEAGKYFWEFSLGRTRECSQLPHSHGGWFIFLSSKGACICEHLVKSICLI